MAVCSSAAQIGGTVPVEHAFAHGEELEYAVSYKVSFVNTDVAGVTFRTTLGDYGGRRAYTVDAHGVVYPFYKWFFDLNDQYVSTLDSATLRPLELRSEIREGKYRYSTRFVYDWDSRVVNNTFRNHKNPDSNHKRLDLSDGSYDALASFFNLRCADLTGIERSGSSLMNLVLEDTIRPIRYRFLGREVKNHTRNGQVPHAEVPLRTGYLYRRIVRGRQRVHDMDIGRPEPDSALRRVADPRRVDPRATDKLEKPEVSAG